MNKNYARLFSRIAIAAAFTLSVAACSTISDLDPTGLLGDDSAPPATTQFPSGDAAPTADSTVTTPDLAGVPAAPPAPNAGAQQQAAQSVAADGAQAQYSGDALRAGTEAAAPPPGADTGAAQMAAAAAAAPSADAPPSADEAPPTAEAAPAPAAAAPPTRTAELPPPQAAAAPAPEAAPSAAPSAAPLPEGAEPAVPAVPPSGSRGAMLAMANPSDAALGFKPSSAPPLNSSISEWVPGPILTHYRQTAALAGTAGTAAPAMAPGGRGNGASGDVIANLDAAPGTPAGMAAAMNGGVAPAEIIYFPGDSTGLPAAARAKIRDAVAAFKAQGGAGSIKVVGHASSRTGNMTVERHLEMIFDKSQKRADAVAQALIRAGIPASKVIVQAVGDSQPVYYESMPKGEDGNRRAEIFLQG